MKKRIAIIMCVVVMLFTAIPVHAVSFTDLNADHWAHDNIIKFAEKGIINRI